MSFRVLHLCSSLGMFGGENVLISLAKEMRESEFTPVIGVLRNSQNPHTEIADVAADNQIDHVIFPCNGRLDFKTILLIREYILQHNIMTVHAHDFKSDFYGYCASFSTPAYKIATCHNWLTTDKKVSAYNYLDQFVLRYFDLVVAVSPSVKRTLLDKGVRSEKIATISNGVRLDSYYNHARDKKDGDLRSEFGIPANCQIIGAIGRLSPEKGFVVFLRAAEELIRDFPSTYFVIVGDGPQKGELCDLASSLGIKKNVIFTGIRNDVAEIYSLMDIFVISSFNEGLPMVLLEAMASCCPVIATNVGAIPQVIDNGTSGLLVDAGNIGQLREAMELLLKDKDSAKSFAQKGHEKVSAHFSSQVMAEQYLNVYRQLI